MSEKLNDLYREGDGNPVDMGYTYVDRLVSEAEAAHVKNRGELEAFIRDHGMEEDLNAALALNFAVEEYYNRQVKEHFEK